MTPVRIVTIQQLYTDASKLYIVASFDGLEDPNSQIAMVGDGIIVIDSKTFAIYALPLVHVGNTVRIYDKSFNIEQWVVNTANEIEIICHDPTT